LGLFLLVCSFVDIQDVSSDRAVPQYGDTYVYAVGDSIEELNPRKVVWLSSKRALMLIYEPLFSMSDQLTLTPRVCESWRILEDGTVFQCNVRKGINFHNGKELTADDVVFSLNYLASKESLDNKDFSIVVGFDEYVSGNAKQIKGIKAENKYLLRIELKRKYLGFVPIFSFLHVLSYFQVILQDCLKGFYKSSHRFWSF